MVAPRQDIRRKVPLAVIVLTLNEEANLEACLDSVVDWAGSVLLVDCFSTDRTLQIASRYPSVHVVQHAFEGYSQQRNWAADNLPFDTDWVLFLDADERIPRDLQAEIEQLFAEGIPPDVDGFLVRWRLVFLGRWVRHGYYPTWIMRLYRRSRGRWSERANSEFVVVKGKTLRLRHDLIHDNQNGIGAWIEKHNRYASLEVQEQLQRREKPDVRFRSVFLGPQRDRTRWLRYHVWGRQPLLLRPFLYFTYRYFFRLGFLDGREGFVFHFLQALWYPFLIDVKMLEAKYISGRQPRQAAEASPATPAPKQDAGVHGPVH